MSERLTVAIEDRRRLQSRSAIGRRFAALVTVAAALSATSLPARGAQADPSRGVIAVIDRTEIEMSGDVDLSDFLSQRDGFDVFGIRGLSAAVGVAYTLDGRRTTGLDFGTLPLSAVERIEIMEESEANISRHTAGVVVNIVLKRGLEGADVSGVVGRPVQEGGDTHHGGAVWGGKLGRGHVLVAADRAATQKVREADRDYSRAKWIPGGFFSETQGISTAGNTIYIGGLRPRSLGDCDPDVYAGVLRDPRGVPGEGCAYAYADVAWLSGSYERDGVLLSADHPFGHGAHVYVDVLAARTRTHRRFAPTAGAINFVAAPGSAVRQSLVDEFADLGESNFPADNEVAVDHRFVGHGNRDWLDTLDTNLLTLGVRGELAGELEYDVRGHHHRYRSHENGSTFVSERLIKEAVESGDYDIVNPLSTDRRHLDAIRRTAVRRTVKQDSETNVARAELAGTAFGLPGGPTRWTAAIDVVDSEWRNTYDYRDSEGRSYDESEIHGTGGQSSAGERTTVALLAGTTLPVSSDLDIVLNGWRSHIDDVDKTSGWHVAGRFRPNAVLTLRAHWRFAQGAPSWSDLNAPKLTDFPYVCDTRATPCSVQQVLRETGGNPDLEPSESDQVGLGVGLRAGAFTFAADWYRNETDGAPARVSPQRLVDLDTAGQALPRGAAVIRDDTGRIERIVSPTLNSGEGESQGVALRAGAAWETDWAALDMDIHVLRELSGEYRVEGLKQPGDSPRHRAHAALRASRGDVTASWNAYVVSSYWNAARTGRWNRWTGHDLALHWRNAFGVGGLAVAGGILNVGNRKPALNPANPDSPALTDRSLMGRTLFLSASMSW